MNYTSGTTGPSKGVLFPNGHVLTFAQDWVICMGYETDDVLYTPMPLFHTLGMILGIMPTILVGATAFMDRRFSATQYWARCKEHGATIGHAVFPMIPFLLSQPPSELDRSHSVRAIWTGPSRFAKEFFDRFGVKVYEVYGQSEIGACSFPDDFSKVRVGSCGRANPRFEMMIVDKDENPVPDGQTGELLVRPKQPWTSMLGYLGKPDKTAEAFQNLWHHTGDQLYRDADGWFFFVDRAKDMIRRRSHNISAYDIELIINRYPNVAEIACIPVPSEHEDEEIKVCVVMAPEAEVEIDAFIDFCRDHLPKHMVPRFVEVLDSLPKTANEKIAKFKLKEYGILGSSGKTWDAE